MGRTAEVREPLAPRGMVFFEGALWRAVSTNGPVPIGQEVTVTGIDGLTLYVHPAGPTTSVAEDPTKTVPLGDA